MSATVQGNGRGPNRGRGELRTLLLFLAPGLLLGGVAVALWAWSAVGADPTAAATATSAPTSSATPTIPGPTPDPTPEPTPETPTTPPTPTPPPDPEDVDIDLNAQYNGDTVRIAYYGMGEEDGRQYARLGIGTFHDGADIRLFAGEPYELPDGRWLHLNGFGANERVGLVITIERDS